MFWIGLILGIIIGWMIEWILDWWFWRGDLSDLGTMDHITGGSEVVVREVIKEVPVEVIREVEVVREPADAPERASEPEDDGDTDLRGVSETGEAADDLKKIKGIGSVYAGLLNEAGIYRFNQLAGLSPDRVEEIIGRQLRQNADPASWIEQAKSLTADVKGDM